MVLSEDDRERIIGGLLSIASLMKSRGYKVPHLAPMRMSYLEDILQNIKLIRDSLRGQVSISKGMGSPAVNRVKQEFIDTFSNKIEEIRGKGKKISSDQLKALSAIAVQEAIIKILSNNNNLGSDEILEVGEDLKNKLNTIIDQRPPSSKGNDLVGLTVLLYLLKKAVSEEAYKIERIVVTEMQVARNRELEMAFINADPEGRNLYKWNVIFDDRTTSCCKNIHRRVGNGVQLDELREIVNSESAKYNAGNQHWEIRDWSPHISCRSFLSRVGA